jgi:hypothetical protein
MGMAMERSQIESVDPRFVVERQLQAQQKTWLVLSEVKAQIKEGMTEDEARILAIKIFQDFGVKKHWHKPYIRFGKGTTLTFHEPLQPDYRLRLNDPYYIDLGPVWELDSLEYEGDVGDTFVLGSNPKADLCAKAARLLFSEARKEWRDGKLLGNEIYSFLKKSAAEKGYTLLENVDGHRVGDFPHQKYSRERLAKLDFTPGSALWILEIHIVHPSGDFGAFFEDVLRS